MLPAAVAARHGRRRTPERRSDRMPRINRRRFAMNEPVPGEHRPARSRISRAPQVRWRATPGSSHAPPPMAARRGRARARRCGPLRSYPVPAPQTVLDIDCRYRGTSRASIRSWRAGAVTPRHPRRHRRCHHRPDRLRHATCGSGRPTACDRRRLPPAICRASPARLPGRPRGR